MHQILSVREAAAHILFLLNSFEKKKGIWPEFTLTQEFPLTFFLKQQPLQDLQGLQESVPGFPVRQMEFPECQLAGESPAVFLEHPESLPAE